MIDKKDIIHTLEEIAVMLDLKGANPFKIRAFINAARTLQGLSEDINQLVETGGITQIKGIGKTIAEVITELIQTGKSKILEELEESIPPGVIDMLKIPGMGPKKVKALWEKLSISTIGELEYACYENRLVDLDGFGKKTQANILLGIEMLKKYVDKHLLSTAMREAETLYEKIKNFQGVIRIEIAGSIRRWKEIIKDIDILLSAEDSDRIKIMDMFTTLPQVDTVIAKGNTKSSITLTMGINVDLRIVSDKQFPYALHHFTGSKEHNVAMRGHAKKMNLKMNEYGLFQNEIKNILSHTEEDIFNHLDMQYIPPELRENYGEIQAAQNRKIPKLVEKNDILGVIHVHSQYSDGVNTIKEMAEAAFNLGYQYIAISDHSKNASYANGLKENQIMEQHEEIDEINKLFKDFRILKSIECDIMTDGSLDYNDEILSRFDIVIASVHYKFSMTEQESTERIIKAIQNPYVTILGHPTGRLLLAREGYPVNMIKVLQKAGELGVAIELNSNPHRLDIDWRFLGEAKKQNVKISINPDAHRIEGINDIRYGLGVARKGWLVKNDVLNCLSAKDLLHFAKIRH